MEFKKNNELPDENFEEIKVKNKEDIREVLSEVILGASGIGYLGYFLKHLLKVYYNNELNADLMFFFFMLIIFNLIIILVFYLMFVAGLIKIKKWKVTYREIKQALSGEVDYIILHLVVIFLAILTYLFVLGIIP